MSSPNEQEKLEGSNTSTNSISSKKSKKNKKKVVITDTTTVAKTSTDNSGAISAELAAELATKIQLLQATSTTTAAKDISDAKQHTYQFWTTQPVPKLDDKITENTYIKPPLAANELRHEPLPLPEPFVWSEIDILNDTELDELYTLLTENYVEDDENMFRFDYSREFLRWALMAPGWLKSWHVGVRATTGKGAKLLAFISAVPATIRIYDKTLRMVEINFLCVHKKLRSKRVAPVLIREVTRKVNLEGIFQATFTAGVVIPKPVGACRYWHRSLNPKKIN